MKANVVCTLALAENSISSTSFRPGDILTSYKGLTVDIGNTDAEGRLVLADAMSWTQENFQVTHMFNYATLTGACKIALGKRKAGIFSTDKKLVDCLLELGEKVHEEVWQLPLDKFHRENVRAAENDISNMGKLPVGGASNAASFLECFKEEGVRWVHQDIGPVHFYTQGWGVRTLIQFARDHLETV